MKKFKFRLQRVQDYRATVRDEKKRVLMLKNQRLHEEKQMLEELERAQAENLNPQGMVTIEQLYVRDLFGHRLRDRIAVQIVTIMEVEEEVKEALAEYVEAAKNLRTLETLREHRLSEFWENYHKEEGKFLDELSVQRGNRQIGQRTHEEEKYADEQEE